MYYDYFGLSGPPFALSNTPVTLFLSWGIARPWPRCNGACETRAALPCWSATSAPARPRWSRHCWPSTQGVHSAFVTSPTLSFEEILRVIAGQLNLTPERIGKLELIQALNAIVAGLVPRRVGRVDFR